MKNNEKLRELLRQDLKKRINSAAALTYPKGTMLIELSHEELMIIAEILEEKDLGPKHETVNRDEYVCKGQMEIEI